MTTDTSNKIVENWLQCAFYFTSEEIFVRSITVFHKLDEIFHNANIGIRGVTTWKQKNSSNKMLPPLNIEPLDLWFQVQHYPFWANLACVT